MNQTDKKIAEQQFLTKTPGSVCLVGAGPGDPDLITVRGQQMLKQADVVVYDYLASAELLKLAPQHAELIYVGKKSGCHSLPQHKINQILIEKAGQHKNVVRLKGGDPYIFGRGGEEAMALNLAGINFEVVPGITAAVAAAAYAGIPLTYRELASEVAMITGHESAERLDGTNIDWPALGAWRGSLVFYMGVGNLPYICQKLQDNGMSRNTPAAIISWAGSARQRTLTATLATLAESAAEAGFSAPAVVIIGHVVSLRGRLGWFERLPLFGKRIVVTRSRAQAGKLVRCLTELGAEPIEFPTIRIAPAKDIEPLRKAVADLPRYDWVVFTSVNGVDAFFDNLYAQGYDVRRFSSLKVCAIGPATAAKLRSFGIVADLIPTRFIGESVAEALAAADDLAGKGILLPRSDIARGELPLALKKFGANVDEIAAYQTVTDDSPATDVTEAIEHDRIDWIIFTSSSTVRNFLAKIDVKLISGRKVRLATIGPITSAAVRAAGLKVDVQPEKYTIPDVVEAICRAETTPI